jgi:hypothetical protein
VSTIPGTSVLHVTPCGDHASALGHAGTEALPEQVGRLEVHRHRGVPHRVVHLPHRRAQVHAGAVHEDVGLAEQGDRLLTRRARAGARPQIGAHPGRLAALGGQRVDRPGELHLSSRDHDHPRARPRERLGDRASDAGAATGHDGDAPIQREQLGEIGPRVVHATGLVAARPGPVQAGRHRAGHAPHKSGEKVGPVEGVAPHDDPPAADHEPPMDPEALLDRADGKFVRSLGEHHLTVGGHVMEVDPEAHPEPEAELGDLLDALAAADGRQGDVDPHGILGEERHRPIEVPGLQRLEERAHDVGRGAGLAHVPARAQPMRSTYVAIQLGSVMSISATA